MLFDNKLAAQRNHKKNTKPPSKQRQHEDADIFEIEAEEDKRRQSEDHPGGDGLARVACRLDDVVFEDRCFA